MHNYLILKVAFDATFLTVTTLLLIPIALYSEQLFWLTLTIAIGLYAKVLDDMIRRRDRTSPHQEVTISEVATDRIDTLSSSTSLPKLAG